MYVILINVHVGDNIVSQYGYLSYLYLLLLVFCNN